jgi:MFS family permease
MASMEKENSIHLDEKLSVDEQAAAAGRHPPIDPVAEKKLLWKCDLHVVPVLFILFLLAFLDRTNIGNARIQGLEKDLNMDPKGNKYNIALLVFFVPYILFEVPSNLIIKRVKPSTWLSTIMILWGIATMGQGLVNTFGGLVAMRLLVGLFEAGLFPGCIYLISMYYKRYELQWRLTLFFSASILAGAFGGLLAFAIANMDGAGGYGAWRWIFIIGEQGAIACTAVLTSITEGLVTVVVGAISKFLIVDWPEKATFLNDEERKLLVTRLASDAGGAVMDRLDKRASRRIFRDWKIYVGIVMYFGVVQSGYGTSFFIPTILNEMGYSAKRSQVLSIPIFLVATAGALVTAASTDKLKRRYPFTILGVLVSTVGYSILLAQKGLDVGVKYFATYLIVLGTYITQPVCIAWISNCMSGHYKRSVASAMQIGFGNAGGIVASNIYLGKERPYYHTGYGTALGLLWVTALSCTVLLIGVTLENRKRDRGERDYRLEEEDADNLGDDHPHFRFSK